MFGRRSTSTPETEEPAKVEAEIEDLPVVVEVSLPDALTRFDSFRSYDHEPPSQVTEFRSVDLLPIRLQLKKRHQDLWQRLILLPPAMLAAVAIFQVGPTQGAFQWFLFALIGVSIGFSIKWGRWKPGA